MEREAMMEGVFWEEGEERGGGGGGGGEGEGEGGR